MGTVKDKTPETRTAGTMPAAESAAGKARTYTIKAPSDGWLIDKEKLILVSVVKGTPLPADARFFERKYTDAAKAALDKLRKEKEDTSVTLPTDAFSKETLTEYKKRTKAIRDSIGKIDASLEKIAFNLCWVSMKQAFKADGYATIADYASDNFGYQKSTCYSLIAVVNRFAKRDEKGALTEAFDGRVKGYSVSKLSLMVNLTDAEMGALNPSMSVRDIKKYVKSLEGKALPELSEGDADPEAGAGDSADGGNAVVEAETSVSDVLLRFKGKTDYRKNFDHIDVSILQIFKHHPDAEITISYSIPQKEGGEA